MSATFAITYLILTVHGIETHVKVPVPVTQSALKGVVLLLSKLVICKGKRVATEGQTIEVWGSILDKSEREERARCKTCTTILSFNSNGDSCEPCREGHGYILKKRCSNIPLPATNEDNGEATGSNPKRIKSENKENSVTDNNLFN